MNTVLFQECVRYNGLLEDMGVKLKLIQLALVGEVVMSEELDKMANSVFNNQVPKSWADKGFLSLKPLGSWIGDCNDRINFLKEWIKNGTPKSFWISGFFFPQAFFTGILQNFARAHVIEIDKLDYEYLVRDDLALEQIKEKPADGCFVYGIYLEGCKWDQEKHQLAESDPKKLFVEMPIMYLTPKESRVVPTTGIYHCPLYKVLTRSGTLSTSGHSTNFVMYLELASALDQSEWIKAGVAAFLALRF